MVWLGCRRGLWDDRDGYVQMKREGEKGVFKTRNVILGEEKETTERSRLGVVFC